MPRPGITRGQVFDAADTLAQTGIQPTIKLVRDRIGGSYSTITPHLAAWKEERGGGSVANIPDMPDSVSAASRQIWTTAWNAAQEDIQTERDGLTAARKEMESERAEMAREITDLETKLEAATEERDALSRSLEDERKDHQEVKAHFTQLQVENARLEERVANTEKRADELKTLVQGLEEKLAQLAQEKTKSTSKKGS